MFWGDWWRWSPAFRSTNSCGPGCSSHLEWRTPISSFLTPRPTVWPAGLSSTVHDYARFLQMLLNGGELDGVRILSPVAVDLMTTDHIGGVSSGSVVPPGSAGFGLGFAINGRPGVDGELGVCAAETVRQL